VEDKTFELLTKIYSEFSEFKDSTNKKLNKLHEDVLRMEQDHGNKLQALFDGHIQHERILNEHGKQLADINNKLDYLALSVNAQDKRLEVAEAKKEKAK